MGCAADLVFLRRVHKETGGRNRRRGVARRVRAGDHEHALWRGGGAPAQTITTPFDSRNVYFDFDRHNLNADARQVLTEIAAYLKENADVNLVIEGHCDERGTNEYNMALGDRRARSARDFLVNLGVDASRISTVSYGEEKPASLGKTEEAWAKNRRAQFVFSR